MADASMYPKPNCGGTPFFFHLEERKNKYREGNMAWKELYFYFNIMFITSI